MSKPKIHDLKCVSPHFNNVKSGIKTFEFRINDRGFKKNDIVYLREFFPNRKGNGYSGNYIIFEISHLLEIQAIPYDFLKKTLYPCVIISFLSFEYYEK